MGKGPRGRAVVDLCRERCEVNILGNWDDFLPDPDRKFDTDALKWWLEELGPGQGQWLDDEEEFLGLFRNTAATGDGPEPSVVRARGLRARAPRRRLPGQPQTR